MLLKPVIKELTWHLNRQFSRVQANRRDRLKPGFEALGVDTISYELRAGYPHELRLFDFSRLSQLLRVEFHGYQSLG